LKHHWHCHIKPWFKATHWGYEDQFIAEPFGSTVNCLLGAQVENGLVSQLALYQYDFGDPVLGDNPAQLSPEGRRQLAKMAEVIDHSPWPIIVETANDSALDEARRRYVISELGRLTRNTVADQRVVVDVIPNQLRGVEAEIFYHGLLKQTEAGGIIRTESAPGSILTSDPLSGSTVQPGNR
jgi:hypothetical protein